MAFGALALTVFAAARALVELSAEDWETTEVEPVARARRHERESVGMTHEGAPVRVRDGRVERRAVTVQSSQNQEATLAAGVSAGEKVGAIVTAGRTGWPRGGRCAV